MSVCRMWCSGVDVIYGVSSHHAQRSCIRIVSGMCCDSDMENVHMYVCMYELIN